MAGIAAGKTKKTAAIEAGYSVSTALKAKEKIESTQEFECHKGVIWGEMQKQGITMELIVQRLKQLLEKQESYFYQGKDIIGTQPDPRAVGKALDMIFKILGVYAPVKIETKKKQDLSNVRAMSERELDEVLSEMLTR